jgi:hypothetical protein
LGLKATAWTFVWLHINGLFERRSTFNISFFESAIDAIWCEIIRLLAHCLGRIRLE